MTKTVPKHAIPVVQVENVLLGARKLGLDCDDILMKAGIPPLLLKSSLGRVSQRQFARLLRLIQRETHCEFWGLCSKRIKVGTFAQCCQLMVQAETLGEALRSGAHFYHLVFDDFTVRIQHSEGLVWVRLHREVELDECGEFAERAFMFFAYGLISWLIEEAIKVDVVRMTGTRSMGQGDASLLFNAQVFFEQSENAFGFDPKWLDCAIRQDQVSLHRFLRSSLGHLLVRYRDRSQASERVRCFLRQHLSEGSITLEEVAYAIGIPSHTLRRNLRLEGHRFQELKDAVRRDASVNLLSCPNLSIMEVAERLGFSEASTFHRSFKKWTGVTPGDYRQDSLAN